MASSTTGTVTFTFTGTIAIASVSVVTQGAANLDFNVNGVSSCVQASPVSGTTCTVPVSFTPLYPGGRMGAVLLLGSGGAAVATGYIYGTGTGPLPVFQNATLTTTFSTSLSQGRGIQVDSLGNVYVAEQGTASVDKFSPSGTKTVLTASMGGSSGALDGAGNFYFGSGAGIYELVGGVPGTPVQVAGGFSPDNGMAIDGSGNLYAVEAGGTNPVGTIFEVLAGGPSLRTNVRLVTGTGSRFIGITSDVAGNVYTADFSASVLYRLTAGSNTLVRLASGSPMNGPHAVALDPAGDVYVGNYGSSQAVLYGAGTFTPAIMPTVTSRLSFAVGPGGTLYTMASDSTLYGYTRAQTPASSSSTQGYTSPVTSLPVLNTGNAPAAPGTGIAGSPFAFTMPDTSCLVATTATAGICTLDFTFSPTTSTTPQTANLTDTTASGTTLTIAATGNLSSTATKVVFYTRPVTPVMAGGNPGAVQAVIEDANSFFVTTPGVSVALSSNYNTSTVYGSADTAASGLATFTTTSPTLTTVGTYTYTAASSGLTSATASETVTSGVATQLSATPTSTIAYVGAPLAITVKALDPYGNVATSDTDTVSLGTSPSTSNLPGNFALTSGAGSGNVIFTATGNYTVTAQDVTNSAITSGTTVGITVQALPIFTVTTLTDDATGVAANCTNQAATGATPDAACSLRDAFAAVDAANVTGNTGVQPIINFASSIYSGTPATICNVSGAPAASTTAACIVLNAGSNISVSHNFNLAGPGPALLAISGNGAHNILRLGASNLNTAVSGLTLTAGKNTGTGGGAFNNASIANAVVLSNDVFYANTASFGGAVYDFNTGGGNTLTISNCTFASNTGTAGTVTVGQGGGAVSVGYASATITNSSFLSNTQSGAAAAFGGALLGYLNTPLTISRSSFTGNTAMTSNTGASQAFGGAIYDGGSAAGTDQIISSTISGNTSATTSTTGTTYGGGIYLITRVLTLTGVTLSGNAAGGAAVTLRYGGGVYRASGTLSLYNTSITANTARIYAGVFATATTAYNTLVGGNTATASFADASTTPSGANNLIGSVSAPASTITPLLSALGNYGGPVAGAGAYAAVVQTRVPLPGSPVLGLGANANLNGATTDSRGYPRTTSYNGTTHVDLGAVETNYTLTYVAEPVSTTVNTTVPGASNGNATATPTVQVYESGVPFNATGGTLALTAASGTPVPASVAITASPAPLSVQFTMPQTSDSLTVSITGAATVASTSSTTFNITNSAASLTFGMPPPLQLTNGSAPGTVTVNMTTSTGAVYTAGADTITLTVTATGYTTQTYPATAVNGTATFTGLAALTMNGTYTYTASDTSASPYTTDTVAATEVVVSDPVDHFTITGLPNVTAAGTAYFVTITAIDASSATDTTFTGAVTLSSTDTAATLLPLSYTFVAADLGVHTFTMTFNTQGTQTLTVTNNTGQSGSAIAHVLLSYVWLVNANGTTSKLMESGSSVASGVGTISTAAIRGSIAADGAGSIWSVTPSGNFVNFVNYMGTGAAMYSSGGLNAPAAVAVDGAGAVWVANSGNNSVSLFTNAGTTVSPTTGFTGYLGASYSAPSGIAIDVSGNVWVSNSSANTVTEILGAAAPTAPLATALTNSTTGARP